METKRILNTIINADCIETMNKMEENSQYISCRLYIAEFGLLDIK